jgi:hypothetical protein
MKRIAVLCLFWPLFLWSQSSNQMREKIQIGETTIEFVIQKVELSTSIIFLNLHEDETTSIEALQAFSEMEPLPYFYLNHEQTRRIRFIIKEKTFDIDPNRIFTRRGRRLTLKDGDGGHSWKASRHTKKLAKAILDKIPTDKTVVAVHNNTDLAYSIKSYEPGGDEYQNTKEVYVNSEMDPDDFIYTTEKKFYDAFKSRGINVILQDNQKYVNDGSLSVYCGKRGIPYINIETQKGHFDAQMHLIQVTLEVVNAEK